MLPPLDSHRSPREHTWLRASLVIAALAQIGCNSALAQARGAGYPQLLGMNIGTKNYHDPAYQAALARLDIVILGLYPGWRGDRNGNRFREVVGELKRRNPSLLVGQYTLLNESTDDPVKNAASRDRIDKLNREDWWLRRADGSKTSWTQKYSAYDINISQWAKPDANGERYPQWLARRDNAQFFEPVPQLDIWYLDNVMIRSRVPRANWRLDGVERGNREPETESAFRRAMAEHWDAAQKLQPDALLMGNADNDLSAPEYRGRLHGVFLEALMGRSWSLETREGWWPMMQRYLGVRANLRPPAIVAFNVTGRPDDYAFFRYAFGSSLLGDGHFSFTDVQAGYSSGVWFDEYDVRIGKALEAPASAAWSNGVYRRRYENALVLVNPEATPRSVTLDKGWKRLRGGQAPEVNNGQPAISVVVPARDGLLLVRQ